MDNLNDLEKAYEELGEKIAALKERKPWKPKTGDYELLARGSIVDSLTVRSRETFDTERNTIAELEGLRQKQEWLNITRACSRKSLYDKRSGR